MCFRYDYDWTASVSDLDDAAVADEPVLCDECHAVIPAGTPHRHIYQQQYDSSDWDVEEAWADEYDALDRDFVGPPNPPEFDPGETFEYECCTDCAKLRAAVRASELEAGCRPGEAEPPLPMLLEAITESGCQDRYRAKAAEMYPELAASGYLDRVLPADGRGDA